MKNAFAVFVGRIALGVFPTVSDAEEAIKKHVASNIGARVERIESSNRVARVMPRQVSNHPILFTFGGGA